MTRPRFDADAVADAVTQPPFTTVIARGNRLRRRRLQAGALVIAALALAGAAVAPRLNGEPSPAPLDGPPVSSNVFTETALADDSTIVMVRRNECAAAFSVSTDAGRSWTAYRGPVDWRECGIPISTSYEILSPTVFAATINGVRYLSRDSAATWHPGDDGITVLDALPNRAVLRGKGTVQAADPATGAVYQLRSTATVTRVADTRFAADGTLWTVGESSPPQVILSRDRGRTWSAAGTLPDLDADPLVVPVNAQQAYVIGTTKSQATVHHTTDAGKTWTPTTTTAWTTLTTATLNEAGHLMAYGSTRNGNRFLWTTIDNGRTFTATEVVGGTFSTVGHLNDAIWLAAEDGTVAITRDGHTWQQTKPHP